MQIDGEAAAVLGVFSSIVSAGIGYGIMKEKVHRLEKQIDLFESKYVTHQYFDATVAPLKELLNTVQRDVKEILRTLTRKVILESPNHETNEF